jgi:F-type H+-transporting ATPase subunit delta
MKGELAAVAAQYAEAVLELAEGAGKGTDETVYNDLKLINAVIDQTPDVVVVLNHPGIDGEQKAQLLQKTFSGKIHEVTQRLVRLLSERRRLDVMKPLEEKYAELLRARKNIVSARLSSSKELSQSEIADIKARLTEHLGKKLELEVQVDKSLLGGVVLRLGDQVIDGSLKGKLAVIEKELTAV